MNTATKLSTDIIKLSKSSDVVFGFDIPAQLQSSVIAKITNGLRQKLIEKLGDLSQTAKDNNALNIAELATQSLNCIGSKEQFSLANVGDVVKVSLSPVAAVIPHQRILELDNQAVQLIDIIGNYFPNNDKIRIGWQIFKQRNLPSSVEIHDKSSGFLLPFEKFLYKLRKPLMNPQLRNIVTFSYPTQDLEAGKLLLVVLKRLFWYSGQLVEEWRDVDVALSENKEAEKHALKLIKERKWFVFEFKAEKAEKMLKWIDELHYLAAKKGHHFVKAAVLFNRRDVDTPMRPYWRGRFGEISATFEPFPQGVETFLEAIKRYDEDLAEGIARREAVRARLDSEANESAKSAEVQQEQTALVAV